MRSVFFTLVKSSVFGASVKTANVVIFIGLPPDFMVLFGKSFYGLYFSHPSLSKSIYIFDFMFPWTPPISRPDICKRMPLLQDQGLSRLLPAVCT